MTWQTHAKCLHPTVQPGDFSPLQPNGRPDLEAAHTIATRFCSGCPVRLDCLRWAADSGAQEIVAGGMWWPPNPYRKPIPPLDLLNHNPEGAAA
ncbi:MULTISPECIES: WhiB family transcriptional regulator [Pseudonocardia]|uniref:Transcriptional regulator WhiB n=2 Tax=Pseudonocardia TaxID=1847 RepID=A0A1Y2MLG7_PSEAH|nr:Transcriptional regulator WhiB [Pseudonocardia autotrophica]TDN77571.1 transcription factor WhiB [Pseudonocardia autotrophica]BBG01600.1 hypothetical protein Pdca_28090 [Pseudonocardia autotrophica]GEC25345.1 hypothetical protein PSA01_23740 [Pseudonocardia saturnea]